MDTQDRGRGAVSARPTGHRKITLAMLKGSEASEAYASTKSHKPGEVLAAFKKAAPYLGIRPRVVHAIDWLFRFTRPQDWTPPSRPIVWPAASLQQHDLGLGSSQVKSLNRHLAELGLVIMRDSPNGKRYGHRDREGRIVTAYGFDLSPLAARVDEFNAVALAGRDARQQDQALRRRASIARRVIRQILETARQEGLLSSDWIAGLELPPRASIAGVGHGTKEPDAELVAGLELYQSMLLQRLRAALSVATPDAGLESPKPVNKSPMGAENRPHIEATNQPSNPSDTVIAQEKMIWRATGHDPAESAGNAIRRQAASKIQTPATRGDMKITPREILRLAPRLRRYTEGGTAWPAIVDAADLLRSEMGISKRAWSAACLAMGRPAAALSVAILSERPASYFRVSPSAYLSGMAARANTGQLHLDRTVWGLRQSQSAPDHFSIRSSDEKRHENSATR